MANLVEGVAQDADAIAQAMAITALYASPNAPSPQRAEAHQRARVAFCPRCGQSGPSARELLPGLRPRVERRGGVNTSEAADYKS